MISYIRDLFAVALLWTLINVMFVVLLEGLCH